MADIRAYIRELTRGHKTVSQIVLTIVLLAVLIGVDALENWVTRRKSKPTVPIWVNYHFTRQCNECCGFCFRTAKTSFKLSKRQAWKGLTKLKEAGMRKTNFAGEEPPFLHPKWLGRMLAFCIEDLRLESVSIVTNGGLIKREFLEQYGQHIEVLADSCGSFNEETKIRIGRGSGDQVGNFFRVAKWCKEFGIKFKLNTAIYNLN